jgi:hypothetical protein
VATEPKAVIDATQKIAKHPASLGVRQMESIAQVAAASKQLETLDQLTGRALSRSTEVRRPA